MKTSKSTADHYTWGDTCDGWHLLKHDTLSVIQEHMPPGTAEKTHFHHNAIQFFFVLRGTLVIENDGARHELEAGEGLAVQPRVVHQVRNEGPSSAEFIVVSAPPSHGDRVPVESAHEDSA